MLKASAGMSSLEYGLSGVLVLALCIVGLQTVGFRLDSVFQGMKKEMDHSAQAAEHQEALVLASRNKAEKHEDPMSVMPSPPVTTDQSGQTIATLGANGVTAILADRLTQQVNEYRRKGAITNAEIRYLIQLANAGHQLADAQNLLEHALKTGQKQIIYNGKSYSTRDFADAFRYSEKGGITFNDIFVPNINKANELIKPFALAYRQALENNDISNPIIKHTVGHLATQISIVTDALGWIAIQKRYRNQPVNTDAFYQDLSKNIRKKMEALSSDQPVFKEPQKLTRNNSRIICIKGSGRERGNICSIR